jgi:Carbohydrate binding module (family 6)
MMVRLILCSLFLAAGAFASDGTAGYAGVPFHDSVYNGGPQRIPGRVQCAYFDLGGEGVAYHTLDKRNQGSGALNPANGTYLNQFRMNEAIGTSFTKYHDGIDLNPFNAVQPPEGELYVGWTTPGEWIKMTVGVEHAGTFSIDLLYTSNRGGTISLDLDGAPLTPPITIRSTSNAAETIPWRQWHHWNEMKGIAEVNLPQGTSVLTLHILTEGNMNLAWLDFEPRG